MSELTRNPDILTCLANLSNDEVFTPPEVANAILDLIPEDFWKNPNVKVFDPACKSGVFLREAAKRFLKGEEEIIPDLKERIDHIFHKQLFGYAITELTAHLSRRTVYCSKTANGKYSVTPFKSENGNIAFSRVEHTWEDGKCKYCGASKEVFDRGADAETHAYKFIHLTSQQIKDLDMKFDLIIGNPPYQMNDGGGSNGISAKPIYNLFVEQAKKLKPRYLTMIIPSRWFAGGKGLDEFRAMMINDAHISTIYNYSKSRDCFPGVDIAGGVCYFLWNRDSTGECDFYSCIGNSKNMKKRKLNEFPILIADNDGLGIIHKVLEHKESNFSTVVLPRNSFGFTTSARGDKEPFMNCLTLFSSAGVSYVSRENVTKNMDLVDKYKVSVGTLNPDRGGVNNASDGKMSVTTKVRILKPKEVPTETYIVLGTYTTELEATNCATFFKTKFARYLISLTLSSMHIVRDNFIFVPVLSWEEEWTDEKLYNKYNLSQKEIEVIENCIRAME